MAAAVKTSNRISEERNGDTRGTVTISAPKFRKLQFRVVGTAPYMGCRFSEKAMQAMRAKHAAGSVAKKGKQREARDFDRDYEQAKHVSADGWVGIPATAFRNAMISACKIVGFKMTHAKLSVFVVQDGFDRVDGIPLVKIIGTPEKTEMVTRNATGVVDIRVRPMWRQWSVKLTITYDEDQFTPEDVTNLLARAGMQVGIGEGRPDSKNSAGLGYGLFSIEG